MFNENFFFKCFNCVGVKEVLFCLGFGLGRFVWGCEFVGLVFMNWKLMYLREV